MCTFVLIYQDAFSCVSLCPRIWVTFPKHFSSLNNPLQNMLMKNQFWSLKCMKCFLLPLHPHCSKWSQGGRLPIFWGINLLNISSLVLSSKLCELSWGADYVWCQVEEGMFPKLQVLPRISSIWKRVAERWLGHWEYPETFNFLSLLTKKPL